jgi:hypothetical protein
VRAESREQGEKKQREGAEIERKERVKESAE